MFTARKRNMGQGNVFTCLCHSVHRGEGVSFWAETHQTETPQTETPLDRAPLIETPLDRDPSRQRPLWTETPDRDPRQRPPRQRPPPDSDPAGQRFPPQTETLPPETPPRQKTLAAMVAGSMRPTGMHTCFDFFARTKQSAHESEVRLNTKLRKFGCRGWQKILGVGSQTFIGVGWQ